MYFLSFVDAVIQNENYFGWRGGRIEVYNNETDYPYAEEEIRYLTPNVKEFAKFKERWDFEDVDEETLDKIREEATKRFNENSPN